MMFPTRDKREERGFLTKTKESIEGFYQRQKRSQMVSTRDKREVRCFLLETREKSDGFYQRQKRKKVFLPEAR